MKKALKIIIPVAIILVLALLIYMKHVSNQININNIKITAYKYEDKVKLKIQSYVLNNEFGEECISINDEYVGSAKIVLNEDYSYSYEIWISKGWYYAHLTSDSEEIELKYDGTRATTSCYEF